MTQKYKNKFHWFYDPYTDHTVCGGDCDDPDCTYGQWKLPALMGVVSVLCLVGALLCMTCCEFSPYAEFEVGRHVEQDDADAGDPVCTCSEH